MSTSEPKMAHVNLMVDTVIANMPSEGLRAVLRSMLAADPSVTRLFEERTRNYLEKTKSTVRSENIFAADGNGFKATENFGAMQQRIRTMLGCGLCYESIPLLASILGQASHLPLPSTSSKDLLHALSTIDGDIVQALTAVQKLLLTSAGTRSPSQEEKSILQSLFNAIAQCYESWNATTRNFIFERSVAALAPESLGLDISSIDLSAESGQQLSVLTVPPLASHIETFKLSNMVLPRLFSGLWQLSSPSWGTASPIQMREQFSTYASSGFTAYDMADHYGDAEVMFGKFRASCSNPDSLFGATKYCVFTPINITAEVVASNISQRCARMSANKIDLLQLHWHLYSDPQYLAALKYLHEDSRVHNLGLCNFDTEHMQIVLDAGIKIYTNQVQFSVIDSRPTFKMSEICTKHDVKLLTYGTLCGGFIAEKWLNKPEPELFSTDITPSQRKYYEMILNWGGWALFQQLLQVLKQIATKHHVSISNVATRWVLDFDYVGAVIVGTRMGVSAHAEENLKSYGWKLDEADQAAIQELLNRSKRDQLIGLLGDCGGEYR